MSVNNTGDPLAMKIVGDYVLTSTVLGKGQFGEVVLARYNHQNSNNSQNQKSGSSNINQNKEWMACKIIKKANLNPMLQKNLKSEIGILSRIQSPYVIGFYDIQKTTNNFYLFMQYCNGGDLDELRNLRGKFTEQESRYLLSQIVKGFKAFNDMKVLHRDLKLANILVHFKNIDQAVVLKGGQKFKEFKKNTQLIGNVDVVIADLGFAKEFNQDQSLTQTMCGTPLYMAPEILHGRPYDHKVDVWSLGAVFYEMLTGFTPFTGVNKADLKKNLEQGNYRFPKQIKMTLEGLDFLNCCLQHDPNDRLSWDELLKHNYFNYDYNKVIKENNEMGKSEQDELLLSYNEQSGIYSQFMNNEPHQNLNEKNAILINTKDPMYFQQTYEKVLQKNFAKYQEERLEHIGQQLNKIEEINQQIGQLQIIIDWDQKQNIQDVQDEDIHDLMNRNSFKDDSKQVQNNFIQNQKIDDLQLIFFKESNHNLPKSNNKDDDKEFPNIFLNKISVSENQKIDKSIVFESGSNMNPQSLTNFNDGTPQAVTNNKQYEPIEIDYNKVEEIARQIRNEQKQMQINPRVNLNMALQQSSDQKLDDFEEIKHSEIYKDEKEQENKLEKIIDLYDDVGMDSQYPLMTKDPIKQKDFIRKIHDQKLGDVFDLKNKDNFNLQSIMIQDDYIPKGNKNETL